MKDLILLLALVPLMLRGQEIFLREAGRPGSCRIVDPGASNGAPILVTCAAPHHLMPGDAIYTANVSGNAGANGLGRVLSTPSPTTFTLGGPGGEPKPGSGIWNRGDQPAGGSDWIGGLQLAGKVVQYALKPHPRLLLDPGGWTLTQFAASPDNGLLTSLEVSPGSARATYSRPHGLATGQKVCVYGTGDGNLDCKPTDAYTVTAAPSPETLVFEVPGATAGSYTTGVVTVSAWAYGGNPAWGGMQSGRDFLESVYQLPGADASRDRSLNFALICYVNRADAKACAVAKWALTHAEDMAVNFGLDETIAYGGDPVVDYISFRLFHIGQIYTLMRSQLTAAERAEFANKMLNDLSDPVLGGSCDKMLRVPRTGTITKTEGNGFTAGRLRGTRFLTELPVGSVVVPPLGQGMNEGQFIQITAVASDTEATGVGANWSGPFSVIPPRTNSSCGAIWYSKHFTSAPFAHPLQYPPQGGTTIYGVSPLSNTAIAKTWGQLAVGLALAGDDVRARNLATEMSMFFLDYTYPMIRNYWTGFSGSGSNYHYARVSYMVSDIVSMLMNSVEGAPDLSAGSYLSNFGTHLRFLWAPNATERRRGILWAWGGDGTAEPFDWGGGRPASLGAGLALHPADPEVQKSNYWLRNVFTTFNQETMSSGGGYYAGNLFLRTPPTIGQVDYTEGPTQRLFRGTDRAACLAPGTVTCPEDGGFVFAVSRSGWKSEHDTAVAYDASDFHSDHAVQRAGDYVIYKDARLVCGADDDCSASAGQIFAERHNQYAISGAQPAGGETNTTYGDFQIDPYDSRVPRWAGGASNDGLESNFYAYWLNDLAGTFGKDGRPGRFHRHMAHLKKPGTPEYVVLYDDVVPAKPASLRFYTHYQQNGGPQEGYTSCAGDANCSQLDKGRQIHTAAASGGAGIATRFVAPAGVSTYVSVERSDGSYVSDGSVNRAAFRVTTCAGAGGCAVDATSYEMMTVHRIFGGAPVPENTWVLNPGQEWTGVELSGKAILFARAGRLPAGVPVFRLDHNREAAVVVAGLAPGTYLFLRNGAPVDGCTAVAVGEADNTAYCDLVAGGEIAVTPASPAAGR